MTQRASERKRERKKYACLCIPACGLPHIRANCQFINITPEKNAFLSERTPRASTRVDTSTLLPPAGEEGRWAASWHAFHLRSDGCGKRWRWQCVLIARSALLKLSEVGPGSVTGLKAASSTRDFSSRYNDGSLRSRSIVTSGRGLRFRSDSSAWFFLPRVFILRTHNESRARKFERQKEPDAASLSLTLFRIERVHDAIKRCNESNKARAAWSERAGLSIFLLHPCKSGALTRCESVMCAFYHTMSRNYSRGYPTLCFFFFSIVISKSIRIVGRFIFNYCIIPWLNNRYKNISLRVINTVLSIAKTRLRFCFVLHHFLPILLFIRNNFKKFSSTKRTSFICIRIILTAMLTLTLDVRM